MYYGEVAEWPKATDCKSVKSLVRIQPSPPGRSGIMALQRSPKPLIEVRFLRPAPTIKKGGIYA